jgi:hypothetical protein
MFISAIDEWLIQFIFKRLFNPTSGSSTAAAKDFYHVPSAVNEALFF